MQPPITWALSRWTTREEREANHYLHPVQRVRMRKGFTFTALSAFMLWRSSVQATLQCVTSVQWAEWMRGAWKLGLWYPEVTGESFLFARPPRTAPGIHAGQRVALVFVAGQARQKFHAVPYFSLVKCNSYLAMCYAIYSMTISQLHRLLSVEL
jgi:hypothetical protein